MKLKYNWKPVGGHVYQALNGARIHVTGGLIRLPDGETFHAQRLQFYKFMRMTGDNRKRSLMACVESLNA
jgi:hypothetical protein